MKDDDDNSDNKPEKLLARGPALPIPVEPPILRGNPGPRPEIVRGPPGNPKGNPMGRFPVRGELPVAQLRGGRSKTPILVGAIAALVILAAIMVMVIR